MRRGSLAFAEGAFIIGCLCPSGSFHEASRLCLCSSPYLTVPLAQAKALYATLAEWNTLEVSVTVDRAIVTRLLSRSGRILAGISSNMGITLLVEREKGVLRGRARTEEEAKEANRVLKQKVCCFCPTAVQSSPVQSSRECACCPAASDQMGSSRSDAGLLQARSPIPPALRGA